MRLERRPSKGRIYLVAVEDRWDEAALKWRKHVVASFGNEGDARTHRRLQGFLHALEGTEEAPKMNQERRP